MRGPPTAAGRRGAGSRCPATQPAASVGNAPRDRAASPARSFDELPVRSRDRALRHARARSWTSPHDLGLRDDEIEPYGHTKAKVTLAGIEPLEAERPRGKYVVVTAITPDAARRGQVDDDRRAGAGAQPDRARRRRSASASRRSGPVFGIKGGAAGGGYSQVIPMEDFNLHLTGDVHAIGAAHNLGGRVPRQPASTTATPSGSTRSRSSGRGSSTSATGRCGGSVIGLGGKENGVPRETEFVITVASEVMAVLALATDLHDLRARLGRIVMATTHRRQGRHVPRTSSVAGSMTVLLTDAIKPNLLQTLEGGPAFVHCGPFANIAHGNNSIIADRVALATNEIVCTEAGFGADMGAEKFFDIKCRASGLAPDAAVVVATVRALKMHGGVGKIVAGKPLDPALLEENVERRPDRRREPREADRERDDVRRAGGRRDQLVPDRHDRRGRGDPRGRPRGRRATTRSSRPTSSTAARGAADLAQAVWAAASSGAASSSCSTPTMRRSARRS